MAFCKPTFAIGILLIGICGFGLSSIASGAERCRQCNGIGSCRQCGGDGELGACNICGGRGKVLSSYVDYDTGIDHYNSCSSCSGSGKKRCYYCNSSGRCKHCVGGWVYSNSTTESQSSSSSSPTGVVPVSGTVRITSIDFNASEGGQPGLRIHSEFNIYGEPGQTLHCLCYFHHDDGRPLRDTNGKYRTINGNVSTSESFLLPYENSVAKDYILFIPFTELHVPSSGKQDLQCLIQIQTDDDVVVCTSDSRSFWLRLNDSPTSSAVTSPSKMLASDWLAWTDALEESLRRLCWFWRSDDNPTFSAATSPSNIAASESNWLTWTDVSGRYSVKGEFRGLINRTVAIKKQDKTVVKVPVARLSEETKEMLRYLLKTRGVADPGF